MGVLSDITGGSIADKIGGALKKRKAAKSAPPLTQGSIPGGGDDESMPSYKRGGKVRKTGPARLHKGEQVLTTSQAKRYRRSRGKR